MAKFLIIGPVTRDTIIKSGSTCQGIGGPVYYQASALSALKADVTAIITVGKEDLNLIKYFSTDIGLFPIWGDESMEFENFYPDADPNHRIQRACIPHNPIKISHLINIDLDAFDAILVSPLTPFDMPYETLEYISQGGPPVFLGAQGYLRHFEGHKVVLKPWKHFEKFLRCADFLFIDEVEAGVIMPEFQHHSLDEISQKLSEFGPDEVIITRGDRGSVVYSERLGEICRISAFPSKETVDPTGLGDTYLAAYAFRRQEVSDPRECGIFASILSSLKLGKKGAFHGNRKQIEDKISKYNF